MGRTSYCDIMILVPYFCARYNSALTVLSSSKNRQPWYVRTTMWVYLQRTEMENVGLSFFLKYLHFRKSFCIFLEHWNFRCLSIASCSFFSAFPWQWITTSWGGEAEGGAGLYSWELMTEHEGVAQSCIREGWKWTLGNFFFTTKVETLEQAF